MHQLLPSTVICDWPAVCRGGLRILRGGERIEHLPCPSFREPPALERTRRVVMPADRSEAVVALANR